MKNSNNLTLTKGKRKKRRKSPNFEFSENYRWKLFSLYIRLRDTDKNGYGECCTCKRPMQIVQNGKFLNTSHAGHCYSRGCKSIKYHEANVNLQCSYCNNPNWGGMPQGKYIEFIIRKYGKDTLDLLILKMDYEKRMSFKEPLFAKKEAVNQYEKDIVKLMKDKSDEILSAILNRPDYKNIKKIYNNT